MCTQSRVAQYAWHRQLLELFNCADFARPHIVDIAVGINTIFQDKTATTHRMTVT